MTNSWPNWVGRPTKINQEILAKLEYAFIHSFTDEEACLYAEISPSTLYRYVENNSEFWERKDRLKKSPNIKAKINWIKKIDDWDYNASREWLERKSRDEFSLKTGIDHTSNGKEIDWIGYLLLKDIRSWKITKDDAYNIVDICRN